MFPVLRRVCLTLCLTLFAAAVNAAVIDPRLQAAMKVAGPTDTLTAIVTYKALPSAADKTLLQTIGIKTGITLKKLPMVGVWATAAQLKQIAGQSNVRSLYLNASLKYFNAEATALVGAVQQRTMPGFGYTGKGVGVAVVDSGIDATHPDLQLGVNVKANAKILINGADVDIIRVGELGLGLVPATWADNVPDTDLTCGHGTHCAGTVGGTGVQSAGKYAGVAPGANLIGVSCGESIAVIWALAGWDYVLQHQTDLKIRVVSNSWGTGGAFDTEDPINVASKLLHDKGITVVFAMGNAGPGANTQNPYAVAPWVIGVAAVDKKARLAGFSSRGIKDDPVYHPTVSAPGVSIVSTKAKGTAIGAVSGDIVDDPNLPADMIPWYCHLSGTSMACPVVSGCVALLLEANPTLTPDQIKKILRTTATRMPGYEEFQVGAGHVNVLAALDMAKTQKAYGSVLNQTYYAKFTGSQTVESSTQDWDPSLPPPVHQYTIGPNGIQSDVFIRWDNDANTFNLAVTDPSGTTTSTGSNLLAAVYGLSASLSFQSPAPGEWHTTIYGLRGQSSGTTGIGVPDVINGTIINYYGTFTGLSDVSGSPYETYIRRAVAARLMDSYADGAFHPNGSMTRAMAVKMIASNCYMRQNLVNPLPFTDVTKALAPYVSAAIAAGGPLRDLFSQQGPTMEGVSPTSFGTSYKVTRAEMAVWLVRALGMEAEARAQMSTATTFTDDAQIPAWSRGYVVVANNIGLMPGYVNASNVAGDPPTHRWKPTSVVIRGEMAMIACRWQDLFMQ